MKPNVRRCWFAAACACALLSAAAALGQITAEPPAGGGGGMMIQPPGGGALPPATSPGVKHAAPANDPSAESVLEDLLKQRGNGTTAGTAGTGTTGPSGAAPPDLGTNGLLREGALIKERSARLKRDEVSGATLVIFDDKGPAIATMAAVPSRMLELMENAAGFGDPKNTVDLVFPIDAQVMQYRGKNYLFLNQPAAQMPRPPAPLPPATMPVMVAGVLPQPAIEAVAPNAPAPVKIGEGELITQRAGRFVKDARTGAEIIVFDGDGKRMLDQPMGLVPCKYLEVMEDESENGTKPVKFRVSGLVTEYRGKNYLYPVAVTVIRDLHGGVGG